MNFGKLLIFIIKKAKFSKRWDVHVYLFENCLYYVCIWLIDLTVGKLKSSQIRQSGEHDIEFSANPA